MTHSLAAHFFGDDFDAALFASDALKAFFLILATVAFEIFARTENLFAEKALGFGLLAPIVDRFRL